jgi:hypothetical protein
MASNEHLHIGYNVALQRADSEAGIIWGTFNALVTANAIVIGLYLATIPSDGHVRLFNFAVTIFGLTLCLAWFLMLNRQFAYYAYWFSWARALEKAGMGPEVAIITRGELYARGEDVEILGDEPRMRMNLLARNSRVQTLAKCIIGLFATAYFLLSFLSP